MIFAALENFPTFISFEMENVSVSVSVWHHFELGRPFLSFS